MTVEMVARHWTIILIPIGGLNVAPVKKTKLGSFFQLPKKRNVLMPSNLVKAQGVVLHGIRGLMLNCKMTTVRGQQ